MKTSILLASLLLTITTANAQQIKRTPIPNSNFPISVAVTVPASADTIYLSGVLPDVADSTAPKGTPAACSLRRTDSVWVSVLP